jgi:hypothetical protein
MLLKRLLIYLFLATASLGSPFLLHAQKEPKVVKSKELEGTVEVSFKIDGAGKVEILNINATSPQLADYVIKKLKKIQLEKGDPQIGQVIKYRFVFKKQA